MQRCVMEGRVRSFLFNYADVVLDRCSQRTESSLDQGLGTVLLVHQSLRTFASLVRTSTRSKVVSRLTPARVLVLVKRGGYRVSVSCV
jgi:hypothetical protein